MFPRALRVASIGGVDLRVDPSWALVMVVLVVGYRSTFAIAGRSAAATVGLAVVTAVLFGLSVLVHELAHALEADHRGADVLGITLFALGGATAMRGIDRRARDEFAIAAIGPWSNIVLAALAGLVATGADRLELGAIAEVAGVIGWLNLGLALFNLVPGAPLDGGRVLRAGVWAVTGDRHRATLVAAWAGVTLSLGLFGLALWSAAGTGPGGVWAALWTGAIGAYVLHYSLVERQRGRLGRRLAAFPAGELAPRAATIGADATVGDARHLLDERIGAVLLDDGGVIGLVTADDLHAADAADPLRPLGRDLDELPRVADDAPGDRLANLLDAAQPFVLITPGADRGGDVTTTDGATVTTDTIGLSSLRAIDRRVQETLGGRRP